MHYTYERMRLTLDDVVKVDLNFLNGDPYLLLHILAGVKTF